MVHAPFEPPWSTAAAECGFEAVPQGSQPGRRGCHGALLASGFIGSKCCPFTLLPLGFHGCLALLPLCQGFPHLPLLCSVSFLPAAHTSCKSVNHQDWPYLPLVCSGSFLPTCQAQNAIQCPTMTASALLCFVVCPACLQTEFYHANPSTLNGSLNRPSCCMQVSDTLLMH